MGGLESFLHLGLAVWVMIIGFAYLVRGPRGLVQWCVPPIVFAFRLLRQAIGKLLVGLGQMIRG